MRSFFSADSNVGTVSIVKDIVSAFPLLIALPKMLLFRVYLVADLTVSVCIGLGSRFLKEKLLFLGSVTICTRSN